MIVESRSEVSRPPLKWAGGKRWQVPLLRPHWERHSKRKLVEPFCGGLAVTLALQPRRALINDANPHLINFYRWIQKGLYVDVEMANEATLYYKHRERFNALLAAGKETSSEAASLFYYLNRTGYNGLCRFNQRGIYNVPFGRYDRITYVRDFRPLQAAFAEWTVTNVDVESVALEPNDFVYADPPYDVEFTQYASGGFSWADQQRAAVFLARHKGPVILVNQATDKIETLYRRLEYNVAFVEAPRRISCTGDRSPALEIIATRNL